jgi:hypothetical protein
MVMNWDLLKQHYLKTNHAAQLDSLALNLTRIQILAQDNLEGIIAHYFILESQYLIEWTVPTMNLETDIDFAVELVDLQRLLGHWKLDWPDQWDREKKRLAIIEDLQPWCDRLQHRSELLTPQSS